MEGDRITACDSPSVPVLSGCGEPEPRSVRQGRASHRSSYHVCDGGEPRTQQKVGGNSLKCSSQFFCDCGIVDNYFYHSENTVNSQKYIITMFQEIKSNINESNDI